MPRWLSAWLGKRPVIDAPDYSPCVNAFGQICLPGDYAMLASSPPRNTAYAKYVASLSASDRPSLNGAVVGVRCDSPLGSTASTLGKHGAAVKADKARAKIRAKCDEMAAELGLPPRVWP